MEKGSALPMRSTFSICVVESCYLCKEVFNLLGIALFQEEEISIFSVIFHTDA